MNPDNLHYARSHEWVSIDGEVGTIGITDHAQKELGEIVYLELPEAGHVFNADEEFGTVESVKAVSELYSPLSGEVVEANDALVGAEAAINDSPYDGAWMVKVRVADPAELAKLLSADAYRAEIGE